jgi:hypothetical protein
MRFNLFLSVALLSAVESSVLAQSIEQLQSAYSGRFTWDKSGGVLKFIQSGEINFASEGAKSFIWNIPAEVKEVRIARDVTVNGGFHTKTDVTIAGDDRKTSVVYGTEQQSWPQKHDVKAFTICTFQSFGGVMTISNLTSLNPRAFHVQGGGNKTLVSSCNFLDRRGGNGNHSDGFEGGHGSIVRDCHFESGDDIIKVYANVTVIDTTIKMVQNSVPIQLGWGDHSKPIGPVQDAAVCSTTRAGGFIGPYVGMYASSEGLKSETQAVFDWFNYRGNP